MNTKRLFDIIVCLIGLFVFAPLMIIIFIWIRVENGKPVIFRQKRVGQFGRAFQILKFRTMVNDADSLGPKITRLSDNRITSSGIFLRKYKLDELPQLINVLAGHLSLVGPRPEVPEYVEKWPQNDKFLILSMKPGVTDYASIIFSKESELLDNSKDAERVYFEDLIPAKILLYKKYASDNSLWLDFRIILGTILKLMSIDISYLLPEIRQ